MKTYDIRVECGQFVSFANSVSEADIWNTIRGMAFGLLREGCKPDDEADIRVTEKQTISISGLFRYDGIVYDGMLP